MVYVDAPSLDVPALQMVEEVDDYNFLHDPLYLQEQMIVQEIHVPSSVDRATQPVDFEQVLNVPVLHFYDDDFALGAFLEQVTAQEFPEVQVPSFSASSKGSGRFMEQVVDVPVAVHLVLNQLVPQERVQQHGYSNDLLSKFFTRMPNQVLFLREL